MAHLLKKRYLRVVIFTVLYVLASLLIPEVIVRHDVSAAWLMLMLFMPLPFIILAYHAADSKYEKKFKHGIIFTLLAVPAAQVLAYLLSLICLFIFIGISYLWLT
jgi:hypothetical protein